MRKSHVLALVGAVALAAASVQAGVVQPVDGAYNNWWGGPWPFSPSSMNVINGVGLDTPAAVTTGQPVPAIWPKGVVSDGANFGTLNTDGQGTGTPQALWFDLGAVYTIDSVHIWDNSDPVNTAWYDLPDSIDVYSVASANATPVGSPVYTITTSKDHIQVTANGFDGDTYNPDYTGTTYNFGSSVTTRYVALQWAGDGNPHELNEVRFIEAVPEPTSLALLGVGSLLALKRRRA